MATVKEAEARGYQFTGVYSSNKEEVKSRQKEYEGYKTLLVTVPHSKYSRSGGGCGYSIYAEPKYSYDGRISNLIVKITSKDERLNEAKKEYDEKIKKINDDIEEAEKELIRLRKEYSELGKKI